MAVSVVRYLIQAAAVFASVTLITRPLLQIPVKAIKNFLFVLQPDKGLMQL